MHDLEQRPLNYCLYLIENHFCDLNQTCNNSDVAEETPGGIKSKDKQ